VVHAWVCDFGDLEAFGEKANASVYLAQAFFAVQVVTVLGPVAIAGSPMHDVDNARAFVVDQLKQLVAQHGIALRRDVVLLPAGKGGKVRSSSSPSVSRVKALLIAA